MCQTPDFSETSLKIFDNANSRRRWRLDSHGRIGQACKIFNQCDAMGGAGGGEINWFIKFRYRSFKIYLQFVDM